MGSSLGGAQCGALRVRDQVKDTGGGVSTQKKKKRAWCSKYFLTVEDIVETQIKELRKSKNGKWKYGLPQGEVY